MKTTRAAAMLLMVVPMLATAQARSEPSVRFSVAGGLAVDAGGSDSGRDTGFDVTGSIWFPRKVGNVAFRGDVAVDRWSTSVRVGAFRATGAFTSFGFTGNAIYALNPEKKAGAVRPYVLGGAGLYLGRVSYDTNVPGIDGASTETNLGIQAGGGFEFVLAGFSTFAEAKLVNVFADGSGRWIPITFGIKF